MNLNSLTIHAAHQGLKDRKFSSVELTRDCLDRIKSADGKLNAFVKVCEQEALEDAKKADARIAKEKDFPVLAGIPCGLKDVFSTDGIETTACSNILAGYKPSFDATTVKKLKDRSMVMLGKLNTDEFTCGASTITSSFGVTRNPWNVDCVAGGSSGGPAAAVAADECIYSLGTDTGGSIRQPASFCGISGLKVTYGRVSRFGVISMASSLDTIGPMGKDVLDLAYLMNDLAGHDEFDATTPKVPVPDYVAALGDASASIKGLTIGLPEEYFIEGIDPEVEKAVRDAVKEFEKLGAKVKKISLPYTKYGVAVYYIISPSEVSANMARYDGIRYGMELHEEAKDLMEHYLKIRDKGFGDEIKRRIMIGTYALSAGYYDAYYLKAQKVRTLVKQDFDKAFEEVDVIMTPVAPTPSFKVGENTNDPVQMYLCDAFTIPASLAGVPGLSVPCGFSKNGLPIGLQIIAPQFDEKAVLKAGFAFQQATDWHTRKPKF